jgi:hypothetical protein
MSRRSRHDSGVTLGRGRVVHTTPDALLVRLPKHDVWIPRRGMHPTSEVLGTSTTGCEGVVRVWWWLVRARGWAA